MMGKEMFASKKYAIIAACGLSIASSNAKAEGQFDGFYFGIHSEVNSLTGALGPEEDVYNLTEIGYGGQFGYIRAYESGLTWGVEISASHLAINQSNTDNIFGVTNLNGNYVVNPNLKLGWSNDNVFVYSFGGIAISDVSIKPMGETTEDFHIGFKYGLGTSLALTDTVAINAELSSYRLKGTDYLFSGNSLEGDIIQTSLKIGLNYSF